MQGGLEMEDMMMTRIDLEAEFGFAPELDEILERLGRRQAREGRDEAAGKAQQKRGAQGGCGQPRERLRLHADGGIRLHGGYMHIREVAA